MAWLIVVIARAIRLGLGRAAIALLFLLFVLADWLILMLFWLWS